jgi:23S rRNA pseudouridine1911/1915/1917 synthase
VTGGVDGNGGESIELVVPALLDGVRVDRGAAMLTGASRSEVTRLIAEGKVTVEQRPVTTRREALVEGQLLRVEGLHRAGSTPVPEPDLPLDVVYEDEHLVVVDKPPDLIVHPGAGHERGTLVGALVARYPGLLDLVEQGVCAPERPGIVHRLDRGTSGLLVVARRPASFRSLSGQLAERSVDRRYLGLVHRRVKEPEGIIDAPIGRSVRDPSRMTVSRSGRPARTRYRVLRHFGGDHPSTLAEFRLETGRTHQIRVHAAAIGHPIVGDDRYGGAVSDRSPGPLGPRRFFLHAATLGFDHPETGQYHSWTAPLPGDLQAYLDSRPGGEPTG